MRYAKSSSDIAWFCPRKRQLWSAFNMLGERLKKEADELWRLGVNVYH